MRPLAARRPTPHGLACPMLAVLLPDTPGTRSLLRVPGLSFVRPAALIGESWTSWTAAIFSKVTFSREPWSHVRRRWLSHLQPVLGHGSVMGKNRQFLSKHVRNEVGAFVEPEGEQFFVSLAAGCLSARAASEHGPACGRGGARACDASEDSNLRTPL